MLFKDLLHAFDVVGNIVIQELIAFDATTQNGNSIPFAPPLFRELEKSQILTAVRIQCANCT